MTDDKDLDPIKDADEIEARKRDVYEHENPAPEPEDVEPIKVGIACDRWKAKLFKKRLKEAGYSFERHDLNPEVVIYTVMTTDSIKLQKLIESMNAEAQKSKLH